MKIEVKTLAAKDAGAIDLDDAFVAMLEEDGRFAEAAHSTRGASDHNIAHLQSRYVGAKLHNLTRIFVPRHHRHRDGLLCPLVPVVDMNVGPANSGFMDLDQDFIATHLGDGYILEPEALLRMLFN